jgi:hypothetical protein
MDSDWRGGSAVLWSVYFNRMSGKTIITIHHNQFLKSVKLLLPVEKIRRKFNLEIRNSRKLGLEFEFNCFETM